MADKQQSLLLIDKVRLRLYSGMTSEVFSLEFPTTVVKDMEVLNHELFIKQFESFLSVHNITDSHVSILLAPSLLFTKDFSGIEPTKKDEIIKGFVENVPFDSVATTTMHLDKVLRVIAANKDLIYLLKSSLEKHKCTVPLALPAVVSANIQVANGLNAQVAQAVLGQIEALHGYNLLDPVLPVGTLQNITANAADKQHPKRLPLMLGAFGGLIAILVGVIAVTNQEPTVPNPQASAPAAQTPMQAASPTQSASTSATLQTLKVDIVHNEQAAVLASQLATILKNAGVVDIRDLANNTPVGQASQINFADTVPVTLQEQIATAAKTVDSTVVTKVVTGLSRDVEIRLK